MKRRFRSFEMWGFGKGSENSLEPVIVAAPGELAKRLVFGLTAMLLFSLGLYICISGLVIAFLALVR